MSSQSKRARTSQAKPDSLLWITTSLIDALQKLFSEFDFFNRMFTITAMLGPEKTRFFVVLHLPPQLSFSESPILHA